MSDMPRGYATSRLRPSSTVRRPLWGAHLPLPTMGGCETEAVLLVAGCRASATGGTFPTIRRHNSPTTLAHRSLAASCAATSLVAADR
jgi:hypothetical protein